MIRQYDVCGTRSRYNRKNCHCGDCREAQRVYHADRSRKVAYGRWNPYVDAEPARQHVKELVAAGLGRRRIAELAGLDPSVIRRLEYGDPSRGKPPTGQIRPLTAERLLKVTASPESLAGAAIVDATGSHRRIQALVAVGWSQRRLSERLGVSAANMASFMRRPRILASRARAIRDLYDELWNTEPQCRSTQERLAVTRAREFAAARGWAKPMQWDDDEIDNPAAQPSGAVTEQSTHRKLPKGEELLMLVDEQGETHQAIADRFDVQLKSVKSALIRARRKAAQQEATS
jgi:transcriptional regulator with XRE-family HTH domain